MHRTKKVLGSLLTRAWVRPTTELADPIWRRSKNARTRRVSRVSVRDNVMLTKYQLTERSAGAAIFKIFTQTVFVLQSCVLSHRFFKSTRLFTVSVCRTLVMSCITVDGMPAAGQNNCNLRSNLVTLFNVSDFESVDLQNPGGSCQKKKKRIG